MINILFSRVCVLAFGTLYPGYLSFKTVRAKNVDEYVVWMMYWILFAIFTTSESFTDIFLSWFPFYYIFKVILILWLLPTVGNGCSILYKSCVHPLLNKNERHIDHYLKQFKEKGQYLVLHFMSESIVCIKRSVNNLIEKSFPTGVIGLFVNSNITGDGSEQSASNIISEEFENQNFSAKAFQHKSSRTTKNRNAEEPRTSQGRRGKSRQKS